jgi:tRNA-specific 2-thiouridylase
VLHIRLHRPARAVAKGQAAVLYAGDLVLGSATISGTSAVTPLAGIR